MPEIVEMQGIPSQKIRCEECERHQATLNLDLGPTWGTICLCGLCALELMLNSMPGEASTK